MKNIILVAVVCFATLQIVLAEKNERQCVGEHEHWGCQSPTVECQRSCANRKAHLERFIKCETACDMACVCNPGFYRHQERCVGRAECPGATPEDPQVPPRQGGGAGNDNRGGNGNNNNNRGGNDDARRRQ